MTESDNLASCTPPKQDLKLAFSDIDELYLSLVKSPSGNTFELEMTVMSRENKLSLNSITSLASSLCV